MAFTYQGLPRVAEPHVYGLKDGKVQLLTYQIGGQSRSGGIPNWRRVDVPGIQRLSTTPQSFAGPRPFPSGQHSPFDVVWEAVQ